MFHLHMKVGSLLRRNTESFSVTQSQVMPEWVHSALHNLLIPLHHLPKATSCFISSPLFSVCSYLSILFNIFLPHCFLSAWLAGIMLRFPHNLFIVNGLLDQIWAGFLFSFTYFLRTRVLTPLPTLDILRAPDLRGGFMLCKGPCPHPQMCYVRQENAVKCNLRCNSTRPRWFGANETCLTDESRCRHQSGVGYGWGPTGSPTGRRTRGQCVFL